MTEGLVLSLDPDNAEDRLKVVDFAIEQALEADTMEKVREWLEVAKLIRVNDEYWRTFVERARSDPGIIPVGGTDGHA